MNRCLMEGRPRLLLVYSDSAYASQAGRYFRRLGWEVRMAPRSCDARKQVAEFQPNYVVIDVDMPNESGWLTAAKMTLSATPARIIMQTPTRFEQDPRMAQFLDLDGMVAREDGVEALAETLLQQGVPQGV